MSSPTNSDPRSAMSVWSHDQLSHLAVHAPHQMSENPPITLASFSASNPLPLSSPHHPCYSQLCFLNKDNQQDAISPVSAKGFEANCENNNTTKLELPNQNLPFSQESMSDQHTIPSCREELAPESTGMIQEPCWPTSEKKWAVQRLLHGKDSTSTAEDNQITVSTVTQSMVFPMDCDRNEDQPPCLNISPHSAGIDIPLPSKVMHFHNSDSAPPLNEDETAQILLHISQNFNGVETNSSCSASPSHTSSTPNKTQVKKSRTFFRPPGLEAPTAEESAEVGVLVCPVCGFSCSSRFHYNSHMNTHGCHKCQVPMCNYTSRTEGRLKKHMLDSHTAEQRKDVGYMVNVESGANGSTPSHNAEDRGYPNALERMKALTENSAVFGSPLSLGSLDDMATSSQPHKRSGGKPKRYPCKQCTHISTNKDDLWRHNKSHIPPEKQLICPSCEFVTEYKHHLQYHMRNHMGSKPFKCSKCEYTCVNKSMLNSHMKSHTPVYHFKCQDCNYMTKYCHSLKMHLFKYGHRRAPGTNHSAEGSDFTEDPHFDGMETESMKNYDMPPENEDSPGPSNLSQSQHTPQLTTSTPRLESLLLQPALTQPGNSSYLTQQLLLQPQRIQEMMRAAANNLLSRLNCEHCDFVTLDEEEMLRHNLNHLYQKQQHQQQLQNNALNLYQNLVNMQHLPQTHSMLATDLLRNALAMRVNQQHLESVHSQNVESDGSEQSHVDVELKSETPGGSDSVTHTCVSPPQVDVEEHIDNSPSAECSASPSDSHKSLDNASSGGSPHSSTTSGTKKSKAQKLDKISQRLQGKSSPDTGDERLSSPERQDSDDVESYKQPQPRMPYTCSFCMVAFQDKALYQIHLGYHGYETPFKCNRCGHNANSSLDFNLHLYQEKH